MCSSVKKKKINQDFYMENGYRVFTPEFHIKRGYCCGSGCRHCPFTPKHLKGNNQLEDIYIKETK